MPTETIAAARWIYSLLAADSTLQSLVVNRIYAYRAPQGGAFPAIVFQVQSAQADTRVVGDQRLASRFTMVVKAIGQGADFIAVQPIAERVDQLLEAASGSNVDGVIVACVRDRPLEMLETSDPGIDYVHLGGLYNLTVVGA